MNSLAFCLRPGFRKHKKVAISSAGWLDETNKHLPILLNTEQLIVPKHRSHAEGCAGFVQWGILETDNSKARLRGFAQDLRKPLAFIEDGFIRSLGIGLSKEPGRSIIIDDLGFYYDATKPSRLETILNSPRRFGWFRLFQSKRAMRRIAQKRVSKYNDAPLTLPPSLARPRDRKRILVLDQRAGDASIKGALANELSFVLMLDHALKQDADVFVKIHPDALQGGKMSAMSLALMNFQDDADLNIVSESVNPYVLFSAVDEVYTVASGMGFEAVIAGLPVHCFGVPYYAGWGFTIDHVKVPRRTARRSPEEVFYVAWMMLSRYVDPRTKRLCSVAAATKRIARDVKRYQARKT
ncbi:hypothetical protein U8C35_07835 [Sinorhizobium medicae]|uniref:capsular polysaccharide export protein, LipB/KpsS family n=1 Tax=Sinorhizobium medicae TaxID=110321 RepID=UPI002AF6C83E|nr:hypothetical protein [Sinorhizobium medicae]WQO60322.1 hypothetical protein U8C35_07835 [Sinorhizobium medicae]